MHQYSWGIEALVAGKPRGPRTTTRTYRRFLYTATPSRTSPLWPCCMQFARDTPYYVLCNVCCILMKALVSSLRLPSTAIPPQQIIENLGLVAARLSCRKQRDGHRWVVSRAKRVAAESGSLVYRVASRLDGTLYFFKVISEAVLNSRVVAKFLHLSGYRKSTALLLEDRCSSVLLILQRPYLV